MNKYIKYAFLGLLLPFLMGCVEELDTALLTGDQRIVIDALITNDAGPYYVRVTKSVNKLKKLTALDNVLDDRFEAVTDAIVELSDGQGNVDTLELFDKAVEHIALGYHGKWSELGVYRTSTNNIQGEPGKTYTLKVTYEGKTYTAATTLPAAALGIDITGFATMQYLPGNGYAYKVPLVSFIEPQNENNYYMFFYHHAYTYTLKKQNIGNLWTLIHPEFSVYDDKYLKPQVKDLNIDSNLLEDIANHRYSSLSIHTNDVWVEMHTLNKAGFDYYNALVTQLDNDGGAYSASPASPPGNFDNGALGFFRGSTVSKYYAR